MGCQQGNLLAGAFFPGTCQSVGSLGVVGGWWGGNVASLDAFWGALVGRGLARASQWG